MDTLSQEVECRRIPGHIGWCWSSSLINYWRLFHVPHDLPGCCWCGCSNCIDLSSSVIFGITNVLMLSNLIDLCFCVRTYLTACKLHAHLQLCSYQVGYKWGINLACSFLLGMSKTAGLRIFWDNVFLAILLYFTWVIRKASGWSHDEPGISRVDMVRSWLLWKLRMKT